MTGLRMVHPALDELPSLEEALESLPPDYGFRAYQPGDEDAWAAIMNTGQMDQWDAARAREKLTGCVWPQFDPEGLFFVTHSTTNGRPVGSACAWLMDPTETETGVLHMVCVVPEHRGRNLARPLCLAVLHRFRTRGFRQVMLNTGDWRLGAVKTYLKLGFRPLITKPEQTDAWHDVERALDCSVGIEAVVKEPV